MRFIPKQREREERERRERERDDRVTDRKRYSGRGCSTLVSRAPETRALV
jgi:hypothetical protein